MDRLKCFVFFCIFFAFAASSSAAFKLDSITIGYSSFSGDYAPLWIAIEEQLGKKYGLDLKAIYAGRIRPQQLLASGEVPFYRGNGNRGAHVPRVGR